MKNWYGMFTLTLKFEKIQSLRKKRTAQKKTTIRSGNSVSSSKAPDSLSELVHILVLFTVSFITGMLPL